jgi:glycosyltransferase involved in cell wall biosynthesis
LRYRVSVVVATYRRDKELKQALESLGNQTFSDFEVVLVDDNDNQNWNEIVKRIVNETFEKYPNLHISYFENHPNLGSAATRNKGIAVARGEYVTFLDDDDVYLPQKLANQYEFMNSKSLDYSITNLDLYYEDGRLSEHRVHKYLDKVGQDSLLHLHLMYHLTGTDTLMFTKKYIDSINGFAPIDIGDEFYLMERAIRAGGKFGYLNCCDVKAVVHYGDSGLSSGQQKIQGENNLFEYKKQFFGELKRKSIRYIKMRHYAVLAFAYLRTKNLCAFLKEAFWSFLSSPLDCLKLFFSR